MPDTYKRLACAYQCDRIRWKYGRIREKCDRCPIKIHYKNDKPQHTYPKEFCSEVMDAVQSKLDNLIHSDQEREEDQ